MRTAPEATDKYSAFLLPVIGAAFLICLTQTLNVIMPARGIAIIFIPLFLLMCVVCRKDIAEAFRSLGKNWGLLTVILITSVLVLIPCIRYNGLISLHYYENNDIIYYLADIEWFRDNAFFDTKIFSATEPFYGLVNYMTTTTRVGMDMLGALIVSFLPLEPHQIYLILCAVFSALCVCAVTHFCGTVLKMSEKAVLLLSLLLGSGIAIIELTKQQYAPQILGVAFFISFVALTNRSFFTEEKNKTDFIFLGMMASAVISVYAEYASYAVIVFALAFAVSAIAKRSLKHFTSDILFSVKTVITAIAVNIPGFVIALRFNLNVILASLSNLDNIDPIGWMQADLGKIIQYLTNLILPSNGKPFVFLGITLPIFISNILLIFFTLSVLVLTVFIVAGAIKRHGAKEIHLALCVGFFILYWAFFRKTDYAYGEYKHIHLILWVSYAVIAYFADIGISTLLSKGFTVNASRAAKAVSISKKSAVTVLCCAVLLVSTQNAFTFNKISRSQFRLDVSLDKFRTAVVQNVPENECVGVLGDLYFQNHAMVYAIRDTEHPLSLLSSSYYTFFVPTFPQFPKYTAYSVLSGRYGDILSLDGHSVLWKNDNYCLTVNNTDVGAFPRSGFSNVNFTAPEYLFRSIGAEATIEVGNTGNTDHCATVSFCTSPYDGTALHFEVYNGGVLLGSGVAGAEFTTDEILIPAGSSLTLTVKMLSAGNGYCMNIYNLDTNISS